MLVVDASYEDGELSRAGILLGATIPARAIGSNVTAPFLRHHLATLDLGERTADCRARDVNIGLVPKPLADFAELPHRVHSLTPNIARLVAMEQHNDSQAPDLATVLRNLAALAPPPSQPAAASPLDQSQLSSISQTLSNAGHNVAPIPLANHQQSADPRLAARSQRPASQNYPNVSTTPPTSSTLPPAPQTSAPAAIDPATITEWAQGLRCVTKIAARNPSFKPIIQKVCYYFSLESHCSAITEDLQMIADQHEHELIWWGGRKALMNQSPTEEQLKAYDKKVYRAQVEMNAVMSGQLKGLGVPFFGVKPHLIADSESAASSRSVSASKAKLTQNELLKLQRRMVEYLEDMYKD